MLLALAHALHQAVAELKVRVRARVHCISPFHAPQVKRMPKALAALSAYAIQRSRALNFKLSVTKSEVDVLPCEFVVSS